MSIAVASTSTASASDSNTVTVTKPTGVAVGDLLLIATHNFGLGEVSCSGFSSAVEAFYNASGGLPDIGCSLLYRIADSSDVAASNYTIDHTSSATRSGVVAMLRVTGWNTGNPVTDSISASGSQDAVSFTLSVSSLALKRPAASAVVLCLSAFYSNSSPISTSTFSNYSITSGVANPTWTEICDTNVSIDAGSNKVSFACAYATTTSNTDITAVSVDGSTDTNGTDDSEITLFIVINEPLSATATSTQVAISPQFASVPAANSTTAQTDQLLLTPIYQTSEAEASMAIWTPITKS